jgi:antirestriction protein ArdC
MTHTTKEMKMSNQHTNTTANQTASGGKLNNSMDVKAKQQRDIYQEITDKIVAALETGVAPWVKPWASCGAPRNAVTSREYSGINLVLLAMAPYASPLWLTYNQAQAAGGQVRKGEHGTQVVLFKPFTVKDKNNEESKEKTIPLLRTFTVFNVQQIDGLPEKYTQAQRARLDGFADNEEAEALLAQARIEHGKSKACFIPSADVIYMPNKTDFRSVPDYYATGLHELTHWTGHKSRLARDFSGRFGDAAYAFEELIAELGAAFLCAHSSIDGQLQHESYIGNWLKVLKNDKRAIFAASAAARRASEFLIGEQEQEEEQAAA